MKQIEQTFVPFGGVPAGSQATLPAEPLTDGDVVTIAGPDGVRVVESVGTVLWRVGHDEQGLLRLFAGDGPSHVVSVARGARAADAHEEIADEEPPKPSTRPSRRP